MGFWVIPISVFGGVTLLVIAVAMLLRDRKDSQDLEQRLDLFAGLKTLESLEIDNLLREPIENAQQTSSLLSLGSPVAWLQKMILQADLHFGPTPFILISTGLAVAGAALCMLFHFPGPLVPAGTIMGVVPTFFLLWRRRKRMKKFGAQLPDALELVARALRAGHSLASGFQLVSNEMPPPIATEFLRTYEEQNFGITLEEAMKNMGERVPNLDLQFFITAVAIQRQTGGDLAEILDKLGYIIRERFKIFGLVQALTAEGRLSGWILLALPVVILLALLKLNPDYIMQLFIEPIGRKMLMVTGVMQVLGALAIRKIVNIRV